MRIVYYLPLLLLSLAACKKTESDPNCVQISQGNIFSVKYLGMMDGARFDVICKFPNGCGFIKNISEVRSGQDVDIIANVGYNACSACVETPNTQSVTYIFNPPAPGTYYIRWRGIVDRKDTVVIR
ncbi:hypothetical protein J2T02_003333 [Chitinophaga terrae (ex Kim and Jung 2007)]|uniref:hypothetical protein n=1 Tax=Chitinophaga terrae (ex Kim and Jung 2007) TaxID=408074 RepID=UPI00278867B2|nr:hypothetical protein [Chitinophaga terrae (ex Kim and Jung 2007)]MDQ0108205.1 hypothetical protein [Chitinophaga terrae (ex Kim and Jung 2007)]